MSKIRYIPKLGDLIALVCGFLVTLVFTRGLYLTEDQDTSNTSKRFIPLSLPSNASKETDYSSYNELFDLYSKYYVTEEEVDQSVKASDAENNKSEQTLEVDQNIYQLRATFISDKAMAVIMVKSLEGKLEDTLLLTKGDLVGHYVISSVERTEIILESPNQQAPLHLKLFERKNSQQ
ncbi:hypothetical protein [Vibrio rotiferianus]|uniref:hypothetical protein n=1 Tax=Vibrio rotiferianus TaxID=190895 RepID=UPI0039812B50